MSFWVFKRCLETKVALLVLQCVCHRLLPDHEPSDVFTSPTAADADGPHLLDTVVEATLGGLRRWDAHYMLHVAQHGYTHENTAAFMPALPVLVRHTWKLATTAVPDMLTPPTGLLLTAVILNTVLSCVAAQLLFQLGLLVLEDRRVAMTAALLWCVSPASAFFMSAYSEPLCAVLSLCALVLLERGCQWAAAVVFAVAAVTRSNAVLLVTFPAYHLAIRLFIQIWSNISSGDGHILRLARASQCAWRMVYECGQFVLITAVIMSGFCLYQLYVFVLFCTPGGLHVAPHVAEFVARRRLVAPGSMTSPWCNHTVPFSYGYIQSHYWHVGFLRYYELRQAGNFLAAAPCIWLVLYCSGVYLSQLRVAAQHWSSRHFHYKLAPYVLHALFLTCFMVTCAHVQVTTRVIAASSPVMYWYAAWLILPADSGGGASRRSGNERQGNHPHARTTSSYKHCPQSVLEACTMRAACRAGRFVQIYFVSYAVIGTALFVNNAPWT